MLIVNRKKCFTKLLRENYPDALLPAIELGKKEYETHGPVYSAARFTIHDSRFTTSDQSHDVVFRQHGRCLFRMFVDPSDAILARLNAALFEPVDDI